MSSLMMLAWEWDSRSEIKNMFHDCSLWTWFSLPMKEAICSREGWGLYQGIISLYILDFSIWKIANEQNCLIWYCQIWKWFGFISRFAEFRRSIADWSTIVLCLHLYRYSVDWNSPQICLNWFEKAMKKRGAWKIANEKIEIEIETQQCVKIYLRRLGYEVWIKGKCNFSRAFSPMRLQAGETISFSISLISESNFSDNQR
jgi:hypothetical protein